MDGAQRFVGVLAKGNGKNNRRSLGFARDDSFYLKCAAALSHISEARCGAPGNGKGKSKSGSFTPPEKRLRSG
jgi:hypothetical protein